MDDKFYSSIANKNPLKYKKAYFLFLVAWLRNSRTLDALEMTGVVLEKYFFSSKVALTFLRQIIYKLFGNSFPLLFAYKLKAWFLIYMRSS